MAYPQRSLVANRGDLIHVETPNGIVNIRVGLSDRLGRAVDAIEIIPNNYVGEPKILRRGPANVRLVRCKGVTG